MIELFARRVPFKARQNMLKEYKVFQQIISEKSKRSEKLKILTVDPEVTNLIIALSVFYKHVILQLAEAESMYDKVVRNDGARGIIIGSYELDKTEIKKINEAISEFYRILRWFELPPAILGQSDVKVFSDSIALYLNGFKRNEQ